MPGRDQLLELLDQLEFSLYAPEDRGEIRKFRCAEYGDKHSRAAQKIIRGAPDALESLGVSRFFMLARMDGELVGAVLFGLEKIDSPAVTVFALGVRLSHQRRGIGTLLKIGVMGLAALDPGWPSAVASQVHRNNYRMIGLNEQLGVASEPDVQDGEFLMTAIKIEHLTGLSTEETGDHPEDEPGDS